MTPSNQLAKHLREVFFGGNWCTVSLKDVLKDVTHTEAETKAHNFNSMLALTYHMGYYITAILKVMKGGPLDAHDKFSFDHPAVGSEEDWQELQQRLWGEVEALAALIVQLPEEKLWQDFADPKYGIYFRNLFGVIEHTHYHLGQVVLVKKLVRS
ncbi:DUF1572 domain-containing protein [Flavobacterium sp.]|uniref:DUF1572 domain-containing protein n=1 Tax=Flavobacterium sp. TaxID=239 RepID=UPI00403350E6